MSNYWWIGLVVIQAMNLRESPSYYSGFETFYFVFVVLFDSVSPAATDDVAVRRGIS